MSTALATLTSKLAAQFDLGDGSGLSETLKSTAFKSSTQVTDEQMTALLIVANQYGLNPFTREIFAFPDKGGIVPVVGVDGWSRIMNTHAQFDGMDFKSDDNSCTCIIYRKDRTHPTSATEYMDECKRDNSPAWKSHPRRMLRHKAMIQAARLAFGFTGIYDQDEAERIVEIDVTPKNQNKQIASKTLPLLDDDTFEKKSAVWKKSMMDKGETAENLLAFLQAKYSFTEDQIVTIKSWEKTNANA